MSLIIRSLQDCVTEYTFVECENLNTFGRFSFNKFNKEVEVSKEIMNLHSWFSSSLSEIIKVALEDWCRYYWWRWRHYSCTWSSQKVREWLLKPPSELFPMLANEPQIWSYLLGTKRSLQGNCLASVSVQMLWTGKRDQTLWCRTLIEKVSWNRCDRSSHMACSNHGKCTNSHYFKFFNHKIQINIIIQPCIINQWVA